MNITTGAREGAEMHTEYRKVRPQAFQVIWRIGDRRVKNETHSRRQALEQLHRLRRAGIDASLYLGELEITGAER